MRLISFAALTSALLSAPAVAGTFDAGYAGCVTKSALDELITAASNQDTRQMQALIGTQCAAVGTLEYSVVDRGFLKSQARVYVGDQSILLWVPSEAITD